MVRINSLEKLKFPVKLMPVFSEMEIDGTKRRIAIPKNRLVINTETGDPLGVVGKHYRLVSNEEAIEMGEKCCVELFGLTEAKNIDVFKVDAPSTGSYCHIDLVHKDFVINLWDEPGKPETYIPYVRITNSYNTTRALRFDIGLCRKICFNGVIFEKETVHFSYNHSKDKIKDTIDFTIKKDQMSHLIKRFRDYTNRIKSVALNEDDSYTILSIVFRLKRREEIEDQFKKSEYEKIRNECRTRLTKNRKDVGSNAYALFNTMTDIASNPPESRFFRRDIHSMQRIAGNWMNDFQRRVAFDDFSIEQYIEDRLKEQRKPVEQSTENTIQRLRSASQEGKESLEDIVREMPDDELEIFEDVTKDDPDQVETHELAKAELERRKPL